MEASQFSFPLRSWTLGGFRAIREKTEFELGGLNILVGANSAGKSSVLHSVLLTAQTLATPMADRPLVLNGSLVRLGLAEDCVHEAKEGEIQIGFGLIPTEAEANRPAMGEVARVDVAARFAAPDKAADFSLVESKVTAHSVEEGGKTIITVSNRDPDQAEAELRQAGVEEEVARQYAEAIGLAGSGDVPPKTVGVYARQFMPGSLAVVSNAYMRELSNVLMRWRPRIGVRVGGPRRGLVASEPVADVIRAFLKDEYGPEELAKLPVSGELSAEQLDVLPRELLEPLALPRHSPWLAEHIQQMPFRGEVEQHALGGILDAGTDFARRWFSKNVRHLGPLRAPPQPLYGLPEAASGDSVGQNGEYTAAVLSAYSKRLAPVPLPDGTVRRVKLGTAVDQWMAALDLLAAVRSHDRGKLGYELELDVEGVKRPLDLTTVGVGVSQALPIIVLGLISEPGTLLLFEQPELHLHPDVQASLGDFFLALARSGRQLMIETHSEYLINRLRRRQKTDPELEASELVRLFFFERSGSEANVRHGRIGQDGSMPNWPAGFLDTAVREVEAMVMVEKE